MITHFNLIDEPWIPIVDKGNVSLKEVFSNSDCEEIGGNPIQKIALTRLLLAIAQSAHTPEDEESCLNLKPDELADHCLNYLEIHRDRFWLYGEKPFLQMPQVKKAESISLMAVLPDVAYGNNTLLFETQKEKTLDDAEKALLIVTLMGFSIGNKRTDKKFSLMEGYNKTPSDKSGPCLDNLHNFLIGSNVKETLWLNLLSEEQIKKQGAWSEGLGTAPWEKMPQGENCDTAQELNASYLGRLVPISRFCLLSEEGIHYAKGIDFTPIKEGGFDPSVASNNVRAVLVDPEKRPWRLITSFLNYTEKQEKESFRCLYLNENMKKAKLSPTFTVWSGGLRASSYTAGVQGISGSDDFVESKITISLDVIGEGFSAISQEIQFLEGLEKSLRYSILNYYKQLKVDGSKHAKIATNLFWQLCEKQALELFQVKESKEFRVIFKGKALTTYDQLCHKGTARQMDSWAKNKPKIKI